MLRPYKIHKVAQANFSITIPTPWVREEAKKRNLSMDEFVSRFYFIFHTDDNGLIYTFEEIK